MCSSAAAICMFRFCQSFMTELSKYIGPELDMPSMGYGVGLPEVRQSR